MGELNESPESMNPDTISVLLVVLSAFLHASWSAITKVAQDRSMFVALAISVGWLFVLALALFVDGRIELGSALGPAFAAGVFEGLYCIAMVKTFDATSLAKGYAILRGGAMVGVWSVALLTGLESPRPEAIGWSSLILAGIFVLGGLDAGTSRRDSELLGLYARFRMRLREVIWPLLGAVFITGYHLSYGEALASGARPLSLFSVGLGVSQIFVWSTTGKNLWSRARRVFWEQWALMLASSLAANLGFILFLYGLNGVGPGYGLSLRNTSILFSLILGYLIPAIRQADHLTPLLRALQAVAATFIAAGAIGLALARP